MMAERDTQGKFKPGHSGNPQGKPVGVLSKKTKVREAFLEEISAKVFNELKLMLKSEEDSVKHEAVKILTDRLLPRLKSVDMDLTTAFDLIDKIPVGYRAKFREWLELVLSIDPELIVYFVEEFNYATLHQRFRMWKEMRSMDEEELKNYLHSELQNSHVFNSI
ncbi:MAG: DUF5681 domain-containing protein [Candidatus Electryonea clarkiae]|nr:DUF5681 domain-containing protein [Candidatus Electryonea clarkiae]